MWLSLCWWNSFQRTIYWMATLSVRHFCVAMLCSFCRNRTWWIDLCSFSFSAACVFSGFSVGQRSIFAFRWIEIWNLLYMNSQRKRYYFVDHFSIIVRFIDRSDEYPSNWTGSSISSWRNCVTLSLTTLTGSGSGLQCSSIKMFLRPYLLQSVIFAIM